MGADFDVKLYTSFIGPTQIEALIAETKKFYKEHYNEENLGAHRAYLSDTTPHRTSHAYAISNGYVEGFTGPLPTINMEGETRFPTIKAVGDLINQTILGLPDDNRVLFNVQEYFGGSEPVPKHNDGELLEFTTEDGGLQIKRSIRPRWVAVLTLVNDTDSTPAGQSFPASGPSGFGGTRVHFADGTSEVLRAEAGELLIFRNDQMLHSVDALTGTVKRPDGILRMTIGWRSLGAECKYQDDKGMFDITQDEAETITEKWYREEWPKIWEGIRDKARKAAF